MNDEQSAPQRLYLMQVAHLPPVGMPFVCYLVHTGDQNILIDSGLPDNIQPPPGRPQPILEKTVVEQLAEIGLQPEDINTVVLTHFDGDHIGQMDKFPQAELVVQRAEYEQAMAGHPRFARFRMLWDQPAARYTFVDGDTELAPGLRLIETSGHTRGHQAVLLHLPRTGAVLLTIDSVPNAGAFTPDRGPGPADEDPVALTNSTKKLIDLAAQEGTTLVIFGHDAEQWPTLKKLPAYYD